MIPKPVGLLSGGGPAKGLVPFHLTDPHFLRRVDHSEHGKATLSVCKWVDELDGRRLVFGISFIIPG